MFLVRKRVVTQAQGRGQERPPLPGAGLTHIPPPRSPASEHRWLAQGSSAD